MTFLIAFVAGCLLGRGAARNDSRYIVAGTVLFGISMVLIFI